MALRIERQVPSVYFGRPGALITLPWPGGDMDAGYDRLVYDFMTGAGQHMVSSLSGGSRSYTVNWNALHVDNYKLVEQYWTGVMGQGPWVFIDPSTRNMLRGNQASATSVYNDTRQFSTSATDNGTLQSNGTAALIHRTGAPKNLRWMFNITPATSPTLSMTYPYRSWWGFPVVPGLSYAFSSWVRPDGTVDSAITCEARVQWVDAAGVNISDLAGGAVATVPVWNRVSAVGVAPAGAAYAQPRWVATGSTITVGASLYVDEPMFEQDTIVNDWAPGTGIRPVEIVSLVESVPFSVRMRAAITMGLRELAP
jgi:hypothetical protein